MHFQGGGGEGGATLSKLFYSRLKRGLFLKHRICSQRESKYYPFRIDPFLDGAWCAWKQTGNHKSCPPCKNGGKSTTCINSP